MSIKKWVCIKNGIFSDFIGVKGVRILEKVVIGSADSACTRWGMDDGKHPTLIPV